MPAAGTSERSAGPPPPDLVASTSATNRLTTKTLQPCPEQLHHAVSGTCTTSSTRPIGRRGQVMGITEGHGQAPASALGLVTNNPAPRSTPSLNQEPDQPQPRPLGCCAGDDSVRSNSERRPRRLSTCAATGTDAHKRGRLWWDVHSDGACRPSAFSSPRKHNITASKPDGSSADPSTGEAMCRGPF